MSPVSPALAGRFFTTELPGKPSDVDKIIHKVYKLPLLFVELIPRSSDSQRNVERSYCLKTSEIQKKIIYQGDMLLRLTVYKNTDGGQQSLLPLPPGGGHSPMKSVPSTNLSVFIST